MCCVAERMLRLELGAAASFAQTNVKVESFAAYALRLEPLSFWLPAGSSA